jgi:hypothetical protein
MSRWNVCTRSPRAGALLAAAIVVATAAPAAAEVRVTDIGGGSLTVEAHDATVQQILDMIGQSRPIRFQASEALSRHVTGTYSGTLPRVLSRILDGYDHVIRTTASGLQIDVVSAAQSAKFAAPVANSVTVSVAVHGVSSNVDLDEENAQAKSAPRPQTVASGPQPSAPASHPAPAPLTVAQHPPVSSNVDLDEETSR